MKLTSAAIGVAVMMALSTAAAGQEASTAETPAATPVQAHGGSLFRQVQAAPPPEADPDDPTPHSPVAGVSFIAVDDPKLKKFKKHDLITVVINEESDASTTGKTQSEKKQDFDLALKQFVQLSGGAGSTIPGILPISNTSTLPEAQFAYDNNRQNNAQQQRTDQFTARIQAEVVDVKPNGNLVVEATKRIQLDKEVQLFFLTGECRASDVGPDNSLLSTQIAKLTLTKNTKGEVRQGTRSGWFNSILDKLNPF